MLSQYKAAWAYKVQNYRLTPIRAPYLRQEFSFINNIEGRKLRILLSNKYGSRSLVIRKLKIKYEGEFYEMTLNKSHLIKVPPFSEVYTDDLTLDLLAGKEIKVYAVFGLKTKATSVMTFYSDALTRLNHYNFYDKKINLGAKTRLIRNEDLKIVLAIARVEIDSHKGMNIAVLGDSLTHHSHWTAALQKRFNQDYKNIAVINAGQGGNRLLKDANTVRIVNDKFGISALNRARNDLFQYQVPEMVIVALGVNDLIHPGSGSAPRHEEVTFEELRDGFIRLHQILKDYNTKTVIMTISPFYAYNNAYNEERETVRQTINQWIREQELFDLVIDTAMIMCDSKDTKRLYEEFDGGDHLHFNAKGGKHLAQSIEIDKLINELASVN